MIIFRQENFLYKRKVRVFVDLGAQRRKKVAEMFNFADVASESQSESCAALVKE